MPVYRVQVILRGASGASEDVYANTYWFSGVVPTKEQQLALMLLDLKQVYVNIEDFMSGYLTDTATIKVYDMSDAPPREPAWSDFTWDPGQEASVSLPSELACCVSFHGAPPVSPRRRGRVYIGPLNIRTMGHAGPGQVTVPTNCWGANWHINLASAFNNFRTSEAGQDWVVHGKVSNVPVVGGWIDDAYDIQRRRGEDAQQRLEWGAV